jgi:hypothetical protein
MAQAVQHLLCKYEALNSDPSSIIIIIKEWKTLSLSCPRGRILAVECTKKENKDIKI